MNADEDTDDARVDDAASPHSAITGTAGQRRTGPFTGPPLTTFEATFDVADTTVCEAVVSAVATTDPAPMDILPLYRYVDVEAIDRLVRHDRQVTVRFRYGSLLVVVTGQGHVRVSDSE